MDQLGEKELQEKLNCIFADIGDQIGAVLRCMVQQEVEHHTQRIIQLNNLLNGNVCDTPPQQ